MAKRDGLANVIKNGDALSEWHRAAVGNAWQLRWAVPDALSQRQVAAVLRELANTLEVFSQPQRNMTDADALLVMRSARDKAQRRLQSIATLYKNKGR